MVFPTLQFLGFFAVVFPVYWLIGRHRWRMGWLLGASCFFYMSWNPWLILLILFSASVDYLAAQNIEKSPNPRLRRLFLVGSICTNLGLLFFFKYVNFFLNSASWMTVLFGAAWRPPLLDIALPLGISFYTFETISYISDVYLGRSRAIRNPLDYALFIMFFPHLVAGPIVRPQDFLPQLQRRKRFSWPRFYLGLRLFLIGFFKKSIVADHLAQQIVDPLFNAPGTYGSLATWLGVLAYSVQIYCDFSGYSDMAIGIAHLFGFKLPWNFNYPYLATSIADFWRRWHISLSTWLRDYLYKPLGGNRFGTARTYRNLILVMLLGGLWHGASWTFVAWGLYHGVLLALHRAMPWPQTLGGRAFKPLAIVSTFVLVSIGWVFFRSQSFADAGTILAHLFAPVAGLALNPLPLLLVALCLALTFLGGWAASRIDFRKLEQRLPAPAVGAAWALFLVLTLLLLPGSSKTFIYFQF
jgi:alginate O-acetyltransferase complex protein AlgI